jgi:zinc protease
LTEESHYGERREIIYDPLARQPEIDLSYPVPPGNTPEEYATIELSVILGRGNSSRMYQHLVEDQQLASTVSASAPMTIGPGRLDISANPRPGVKVEELEKGVDEEIATIAKNGVTAAELAKAKKQLLSQFIEPKRSSLYTAVMIGDDAVKFNDPNLINTMPDKENAVTVDEVNAAAKKFLVQDQRSVVVTIPASATESAAAGGAR